MLAGIPTVDVERFLGTVPVGVHTQTNDKIAPASNTAAVITLVAPSDGYANVLSGVAWSYDGSPTAGNLKIEDGSGTTVFEIDVSKAGPDCVPFNPPMRFSDATATIITLHAGGSGVSGKVSLLGHWVDQLPFLSSE